jgi:hypothetical protein
MTIGTLHSSATVRNGDFFSIRASHFSTHLIPNLSKVAFARQENLLALDVKLRRPVNISNPAGHTGCTHCGRCCSNITVRNG